MKSINNKKPTKKLAIKVVAIILIVIVGGLGAYVYYIYSNAGLVSYISYRDLIISSATNTSRAVPVDPKTGDLYFPESKLYLPNPKDTDLVLKYSWYLNGEDNQEELKITQAYNPKTHTLYNANNFDQLMEAVPKFLACHRGATLVYNKIRDPDNIYDLKHELRLNNNKKLYIYLEKDCSELSGMTNKLKNIRAY
jgi:hypothetical protein